MKKCLLGLSFLTLAACQSEPAYQNEEVCLSLNRELVFEQKRSSLQDQIFKAAKAAGNVEEMDRVADSALNFKLERNAIIVLMQHNDCAPLGELPGGNDYWRDASVCAWQRSVRMGDSEASDPKAQGDCLPVEQWRIDEEVEAQASSQGESGLNE